MIDFDLPFPPSVNHYWRSVGGRTLISRRGRLFRQQVVSILAARGVRPLDGPLEVFIELYPPDRRRRDIDNCLKSLLDALQHGGAYIDDSQICVLHAKKKTPVKNGSVFVSIQRINELECQTSR